MFNLQGALRSFAGFYCITSSFVCQELFSNSFELFVICSPVFDFLSRSELIYSSTSSSACQELFSKLFDLFSCLASNALRSSERFAMITKTDRNVNKNLCQIMHKIACPVFVPFSHKCHAYRHLPVLMPKTDALAGARLSVPKCLSPR